MRKRERKNNLLREMINCVQGVIVIILLVQHNYVFHVDSCCFKSVRSIITCSVVKVVMCPVMSTLRHI